VPDTKLGDAMSYTLNQWDYLTRYTSNGRMPIDNNILEREIRVFATGRKSWLLSDTADGARASAVIYSLMLTCRACGLDPLAWLRHVLTELAAAGRSGRHRRPAAIQLLQDYCGRVERDHATPRGHSSVPQTSMRIENRAYTVLIAIDVGMYFGATLMKNNDTHRALPYSCDDEGRRIYSGSGFQIPNI
jgi:hypothetical protein